MTDFSGTAVVVLAAGLSQRYGSNDKLLAPFDGVPLATHCAALLSGMPFAQRIAVCRDDPQLTAIFADRGFTIVLNPDSGRGQASSLALGIAAAASAGADVALVCLADMPRVSQQHLMSVLDVVPQSATGIVASIPSVGATPSPPAAFTARHFMELTQLVGDKGARQLLADASHVVAAPRELADFDVPADFAANA